MPRYCWSVYLHDCAAASMPCIYHVPCMWHGCRLQIENDCKVKSVWAKFDKIADIRQPATISVVVKSDHQIEDMWPCSLTKPLASLSKTLPHSLAFMVSYLTTSNESSCSTGYRRNHSMPAQAPSSKGIVTCITA